MVSWAIISINTRRIGYTTSHSWTAAIISRGDFLRRRLSIWTEFGWRSRQHCNSRTRMASAYLEQHSVMTNIYLYLWVVDSYKWVASCGGLWGHFRTSYDIGIPLQTPCSMYHGNPALSEPFGLHLELILDWWVLYIPGRTLSITCYVCNAAKEYAVQLLSI